MTDPWGSTTATYYVVIHSCMRLFAFGLVVSKTCMVSWFIFFSVSSKGKVPCHDEEQSVELNE